MVLKKCSVCGTEFKARTSRCLYCGPSCRAKIKLEKDRIYSAKRFDLFIRKPAGHKKKSGRPRRSMETLPATPPQKHSKTERLSWVQVLCKCPKCEIKYTVPMLVRPLVMPRIYCDDCRFHLPQVDHIFCENSSVFDDFQGY